MNKRLILYVASMAAFAGPFTQSIYTPMLPVVQAEFQTTVFLINLTISVFTFVLAGMQFIYGPLVDAKGRRKIQLPGLVLFVLGSIGAALSSSIDMFLFFRVVQAAGVAVGSVVAATVIADLYNGKKRGRAMGTFQTLVALGAVTGPIIGGTIGEYFGFQGVFWTLVFFGLLLLVLNYLYLPETRQEKTIGKKMNFRDFGYVIKDRVGISIILLAFIQYYIFYNFLVFLPSILTAVYTLSVSQNGLVFLPLTISVVLGSLIGGRLQEYFRLPLFLLTIACLHVSSTVLFSLFALVSLQILIITITLFGLCLGLSLPVQTTLLTNRFIDNRGTAISVYNFFRYLGMGCGPIVGSFFYKINMLLEFIVAAILFGLVVLYIAYQIVLLPRRENNQRSQRVKREM